MKKTPRPLAAAVTAALGATAAEAGTYTATLKQVASWSGSGSSTGNITSSTATFSYDDVTGLLTQTGGTFNVRYTITPTTTLFRHSITGLVVGAGGAAAAGTFVCTEGNFGPGVGASLCGNYNFGANLANESTATWGPGTSVSRIIGGDDMALGPAQGVSLYDGMATVTWVGTTLRLSNATCGIVPTTNCGSIGGFNRGYTFTLEAVQAPVPAAVWLFGGALAALGLARRRSRTA